MEQLIREFGAWLKQGFGWLVDVIVFGCLWASVRSRGFLVCKLAAAPILKMAVFVLPCRESVVGNADSTVPEGV
jgi:hypothetical protein